MASSATTPSSIPVPSFIKPGTPRRLFICFPRPTFPAPGSIPKPRRAVPQARVAFLISPGCRRVPRVHHLTGSTAHQYLASRLLNRCSPFPRVIRLARFPHLAGLCHANRSIRVSISHSPSCVRQSIASRCNRLCLQGLHPSLASPSRWHLRNPHHVPVLKPHGPGRRSDRQPCIHRLDPHISVIGPQYFLKSLSRLSSPQSPVLAHPSVVGSAERESRKRRRKSGVVIRPGVGIVSQRHIPHGSLKYPRFSC